MRYKLLILLILLSSCATKAESHSTSGTDYIGPRPEVDPTWYSAKERK